MDEDKKYFKSYPDLEKEKKQEQERDYGESNSEMFQEPPSVYNISKEETTTPHGEFDYPYGDNGYSQYPEDTKAFPLTYEPVKKKSWKKGILLAFGGVLAVLVISFSAIGVYSTFFVDHNKVASATSQEVKKTVEKSTSSGNELSVADINSKVGPAVVGITGTSLNGAGTGSGFIIKENGYIVTNAHVVNGFDALMVTLQDGSEHQATLVGLDVQTDLAVIKIDGSNLAVAELGDSDSLVVGDDVVVIGNPLGLDFAGSVTNGIVSALDRKVEIEGTAMEYIQTNAAINSGNSGGPLVNAEGLIVGINAAKIDSTVAEGMGFAIPVNDALPIINELIENGYVSGRPMIGIGGEDVGDDLAAYNRVPTGVYVTVIDPNGAAANSGIAVGDIITTINGVEIKSIAQLNEEKNKFAPGDKVELTYYRMQTGENGTVKITLTEDKGSE